MIQRHFKLALTAGHSLPLVINANQYDSGEQWLFTLYNDGVKYNPSTGAIVGIKADRLGIINTGTVDANGRVVINETRQMTAAVGKNIFELLIDDQTHGTANFMVLVEPRPGDNADLSESDYSLFEEAIQGTSLAAIKAGVQEWMDENLTDPTDPIVDASLSLSGAAADAKKTGDEISSLKSALDDLEEQIEGGTGSGLTSAIKSALLQLAQKVAYIDDDGQTYYDDLYDALYPTVVYTAITLNKSSLSFGSLNTTQTLVATTTPSGGNVTWSSSNTSVATVSQTGVVTAVGYGNATITATCGSLTATCSVAIAQATVTSISAVYTQSGVVYDNASLDSLKSDIVVTANWSNGASSTVASADYTLSGSLAVGTSTVTVSYGGQIDTFSVTVTEAPVMPLYSWDFTQSLTDTIEGATAVLGSGANRSDAGVNFTTTGSNGYCRLLTSAIDMTNKTVEIDVAADAMTGTVNHSRLFAIATTPPDANSAASSLIYRYSTSIGWTMYTGSDWCGEYLNRTTYPVTYFAGKTVKWYMDSDGIVTLSVATIGSDEFTILKTFTNPVVSDYRTGVPMMGSSKGNNMNGVTISGVRIYNGQV